MGSRVKPQDIVGQQFGRLTATALGSRRQGRSMMSCECSCGSIVEIQCCNLVSGHTQSCGCLKKAAAAGVGQNNTTHGLSKSSEYSIWARMFQRCTNPNRENYADYGGRGITVCPEWSSFEQFYADMGPRPSKDHSLDRIDNNGNYCKENCRWATRKEQQNNKRSSSLLEFNGQVQTVSQWASSVGMHVSVLVSRLKRGWDMDRALTSPVRKRRSHDTAR